MCNTMCDLHLFLKGSLTSVVFFLSLEQDMPNTSYLQVAAWLHFSMTVKLVGS